MLIAQFQVFQPVEIFGCHPWLVAIVWNSQNIDFQSVHLVPLIDLQVGPTASIRISISWVIALPIKYHKALLSEDLIKPPLSTIPVKSSLNICFKFPTSKSTLGDFFVDFQPLLGKFRGFLRELILVHFCNESFFIHEFGIRSSYPQGRVDISPLKKVSYSLSRSSVKPKDMSQVTSF